MSTRIPRLRNEVEKRELGAHNVGEKSRSPLKGAANVARSPLKRPNRTTASAKNGRKIEKPETKLLPEKKSPLREVNANRHRAQQPNLVKQTKTSLHDRRGISEIKRSEQNLRIKLESMEHDMESLKHELYEVKREMDETNLQLEKREINENCLKENIERLRRENVVQSAALEQIGRNPVSLTPITPTVKFDKLLTSSGETGKCFAEELRSRMTETERSLDKTLALLGACSETMD